MATTNSFNKRSSSGTPANRPISLAKKRRAAESSSKDVADKVALEMVLGLTCYSGASLSSSENCVAYPAGCMAVLFHPKGKGKQMYIHNRKSISCLCFSLNGFYLATGESGHEPCVRVWDCRSPALVQIVQLKGHHYGVQNVIFSPSAKHLVSIGYEHDRQIIVWNWKAGGTKLVHGKFASKVNSAAFSFSHTTKLESNYFVTAHSRRVQFWYYTTNDDRVNNTTSLKSRSAILGELQDNNFVAVCCGQGQLSNNTYTLTKSGKLCLFNKKRTLERFTEAKTSPAYSLALGDSYLFCGCSNGVIRIFDPYTLDYIISMPHPHPLGIDVASLEEIGSSEKHKYPDTVAMAIEHNRLTVVYNDHSLYVWDVSNVKQIGGVHSFLFHSAGIWDICTYPTLDDESYQLLPESCFITCSTDNTVRFWCLDQEREELWSHKNNHSKQLIRVIYTDPADSSSLKDLNDMVGCAATDNTKGVRSIQVHPNGQHIATGDRIGNLVVYDLQFMDKIYKEIAHDSEILSLSYSPLSSGYQLLSTGSRDRMVHIFSNTESSYEPIQSLTDHSASVTAVKFVLNKDGDLQLLSSGADKSIVFHSLEEPHAAYPIFNRSSNVVSKATIYDMDIDVHGKHIVVAGQDRILRFYLVNSGKQRFLIKAPTGDSDGALLKVSLDPSGLYVATSCADKSVLIFDVFSGECVSRLTGHSELVTQVVFSKDCKYLYSVSGDSCIFVWRLSKKLTQTMLDRRTEMGRTIPSSMSQPLSPPPVPICSRKRTSTPCSPHPTRGRASNFPDFGDEDVSAETTQSTQQNERAPLERVVAPVEGRWAERVGDGDISFAIQERDSDAEISLDLSAEISRIIFENQNLMEVIDLTQDYEDSTSTGNTEAGKNESDDDEEIVFFNEIEDIDPSQFSVTTPTRQSNQKTGEMEDSEEDPSPRVSPSDSPVSSKVDVLTSDDTAFLRANFESLEKPANSLEVQFLTIPSPRLSISAKYLEQSMQKSQPLASFHGNKGSPELMKPAGIVVCVQDINSQQAVSCSQAPPAHTSTPQLAHPRENVNTNTIEGLKERDKEPNSGTCTNENTFGDVDTPEGDSDLSHSKRRITLTMDEEGQLEISGESSRRREEPQTKLKRRLSFELALDETKKKLEELGYPVNYSKVISTKLTSPTLEITSSTLIEESLPDELLLEESPPDELLLEELPPTELLLEGLPPTELLLEPEELPPTELIVEESPPTELIVEESPPTELIVEESPPTEILLEESPPAELIVESPPAELTVEESPPAELLVESLPAELIVEESPPTELLVESLPAELIVEESPPAEFIVESLPAKLLVESPPAELLITPSHTQDSISNMGLVVNASDNTMDEDREMLLSRVSVLTENLTSNFQALIELHDQVLASMTKAEPLNNREDVVGTIATYLVAHENNIVSLVNRNRRVWNGLTRKTNTFSREVPRIDHTPSCVTSNSPLGTTLAADKYLSSMDTVQDAMRLCEGVDGMDEITPPPCEDGSEAAGSDTDDLRRACTITSQLMSILNTLYTRKTTRDKQTSTPTHTM